MLRTTAPEASRRQRIRAIVYAGVGFGGRSGLAGTCPASCSPARWRRRGQTWWRCRQGWFGTRRSLAWPRRPSPPRERMPECRSCWEARVPGPIQSRTAQLCADFAGCATGWRAPMLVTTRYPAKCPRKAGLPLPGLLTTQPQGHSDTGDAVPEGSPSEQACACMVNARIVRSVSVWGLLRARLCPTMIDSVLLQALLTDRCRAKKKPAHDPRGAARLKHLD